MSPPELEITKEDKLLIKCVEAVSFSKNIIDKYNYMLDKLANDINNEIFETNEGLIELEFVKYNMPKSECTQKIFTPRIARKTGRTYSNEIIVNIKHLRVVDGKYVEIKENREENVVYDSIVTMVGSKNCVLSKMNENQLFNAGEDPNDPFGYFVVKGTERVIVGRENLRDFLPVKTLNKNGIFELRRTFPVKNGSIITILTLGKVLKTIKIKLNFLAIKDKEKQSIPIFVIFLYMHRKTMLIERDKSKKSIKKLSLSAVIKDFNIDDVIEDIMIFVGNKKEISTLKFNLKSSIAKFDTYKQKGITDKIKGKAKIDLEDEYDADELIMNKILNDIYPIAENDLIQDEKFERRKLNRQYDLLCQDTADTLRYLSGFTKLDDRDNYAYKLNKDPADSSYHLLSGLREKKYSIIQAEIKKNKQKDLIKPTYIGVFRKNSTIILKDYSKAFNESQWGVASYKIGNIKIASYKSENITEFLKRDTPLSVLSSIAKTQIVSNKRSAIMKIRMPNPSQIGYICTVKTPDGSRIGHVKYYACTAGSSIEAPIDSLIKLIKGPLFNGLISKSYKDNYNIPFLINGYIYGWVNTDISQLLINYGRRTGKLPKDCCIFFNDKNNCIEYFSNTSRLVRPLLIVKNRKLVIDELDLWNNSIDNLIKNGCLEYVDSREIENINIIICYSIEKFYTDMDRLNFLENAIDDLKKYDTILYKDFQNAQLSLNIIKALNYYDNLTFMNYLKELLQYIELYENNFELKDYLSELIEDYSTDFKGRGNDALPYYEKLDNDIDKLIDLYTKIENSDKEIVYKYINITRDYVENKLLTEMIGPQNKDDKKIEISKELESNIIDQNYLNDLIKIKKIYDITADLPKLRGLSEGIKTFIKIISEKKYDSKMMMEYAILFNEYILNYKKIDTYHKFLKEHSKLIINKYTHVEVSPVSQMSIISALIPKSNHNQMPRNSYQSGMYEQALGKFNLVHWLREPTSYKILSNPTRSKFDTNLSEISGLNNSSAGEMTLVAYLVLPENEEDAIAPNEDYEGFQGFKYTCSTLTRKIKANFTEKFERPLDEFNQGKFSHIEDNGHPMLGTYISQGTCLIGKIGFNSETKETINLSFYVGVGDGGYVDSVNRSINADGEEQITVRLRKKIQITIGNKFASRSAQKGVIGPGIKGNESPYICGGPSHRARPEFFISAFGQPSRMTIGKMIEALASKVAIRLNSVEDATAFKTNKTDYYSAILKYHGIDEYGSEKMRHPNGKMLKTDVFVFPCFYQALRQIVIDKTQVRGTGLLNPLNRQPTKGRRKKGSSRQGEMERDANATMGASSKLLSIYKETSDPKNVTYCTICGHIAIDNVQTEELRCLHCDKSVARFGYVDQTYCYQMLIQMLQPYGIALTNQFEQAIPIKDEYTEYRECLN